MGKKRKYTDEKKKEERGQNNEDRERLDWMMSEERRKSLELYLGSVTINFAENSAECTCCASQSTFFDSPHAQWRDNKRTVFFVITYSKTFADYNQFI